jgi:NADH-quinone oxidoreductase subunit L
MFRLVSLTFTGSFRGTHEQEHHLHESPSSMTIPLVVLAFLSIVGGWVGLPAVFGENADRFKAFLSPVLLPITGREAAHEALPHATEWFLIGLSVAAAAAGILLAAEVVREGRRTRPGADRRLDAGLYSLIAEKFRIDELYDVLFVRPYEWLARTLWKVVDVLIIDGVLNAAASSSS